MKVEDFWVKFGSVCALSTEMIDMTEGKKKLSDESLSELKLQIKTQNSLLMSMAMVCYQDGGVEGGEESE